MAAARGPWGWHQLDERWVRRLVRSAGVGDGDLVVDVGAGTGAITAELVRAGARVIAVELHGARAAALRLRFAGDPVVVVRTDATDLRLPRQPFKVVANPPFAVTAALLRRLTSRTSALDVAALVLPQWAVARWAGGRGPAAGSFTFATGGAVPRHAFRPPPPAPASVLVVRRVPERRGARMHG